MPMPFWRYMDGDNTTTYTLDDLTIDTEANKVNNKCHYKE